MKTAAEHFVNTYTEDNVVRWMSNNTVPPLEILTELFVAGFITRESHFDSLAASKIEQAKFLEQYVARRRKYGYSAEEKAEMANAFGGETVVDIFTGEVVAL